MMGQGTLGLNDAENIAKILIETIVNEAIMAITKRTDSSYEFYKCFKYQTAGNEDILNYDDLKRESLPITKGPEYQETFSVNAHLSDIGYPSQAGLPEVFVDICSLPSSSKHGEGDYQESTMQNSTRFYQSGLETEKSCHGMSSSDSSLNTDTSNNKIIENLQSNLQNFSFDNIQLSDSEVDGSLHSPIKNTDDDKFQKSSPQYIKLTDDLVDTRNILQHCQEFDDYLNSQIGLFSCQETNDYFCNQIEQQDYQEPDDFLDNQNTVKHSQKFYRFNNPQYTQDFSFNSVLVPTNYQPVTENYEKNNHESKEEERENVSSGSSQELAIVECEDKTFCSAENLHQTNPFRNSLLCSNKSSTCSTLQPSTSLSSNFQERLDTDQIKEFYWEESLKNKLEAVKSSETQNIEDNGDIQTRTYWSSVGLINENIINKKYLGETGAVGIETIKGMTPVKQKYLDYLPEKIMSVTEPDCSDGEESIKSNQEFSADDKVNYLSFSDKMETKPKKKKKMLSRLSSSISKIFKLTKKSKQ